MYDVKMQQVDDKTAHFNKVLGEIIKELRTSKTNLSINKFAMEFDIDRGNLSKLENGVLGCRMLTAWKIAEGMNIKLSDLVKLLEEKLGKDFKLMDE